MATSESVIDSWDVCIVRIFVVTGLIAEVLLLLFFINFVYSAVEWAEHS